MRVILAVHGFPPLQNAGAERAAERIALWLMEHGHYVEVFTIGHLDQPIPELTTHHQDGFLVHRLSFDSHDGNEFTNLYNNPLVGEMIKPIIARGQFDLLHMISGYLLGGQVIDAAHQAGIPVVITLTEYFYMCPRLNLMHADSTVCRGPESDAKCSRCLLEGMRRFYYLKEASPTVADAFWTVAQNASFARRKSEEVAERHRVMQAALNHADLVIAPSKFILEKYAEYGYQHPQSVFIQHGVNRPEGMPPNHTLSQPRHISFGYMGQIKAHKGVDLATSAILELLDAGHSCSLQIWGRDLDDTEYYTRLQKRTKYHRDVYFCGPFDGARVWEVLNGIDVLIVPSRWYENCPTVILEAFKMNIPVIATNLGGMAELVQHEQNGLTFRVNDAHDLRRQMERMITEPGLFQKIKQGIPYIKSASEEVHEIYEQYELLLAKTRPQIQMP